MSSDINDRYQWPAINIEMSSTNLRTGGRCSIGTANHSCAVCCVVQSAETPSKVSAVGSGTNGNSAVHRARISKQNTAKCCVLPRTDTTSKKPFTTHLDFADIRL